MEVKEGGRQGVNGRRKTRRQKRKEYGWEDKRREEDELKEKEGRRKGIGKKREDDREEEKDEGRGK